MTDNDQGEITVTHAGKELRGWSYANDDERRAKMLMAREYVEGWCDGSFARTERIKNSLYSRFNDYLCEMKPDYDDSIVGFNEAWDVTRKLFAEDWAKRP
ncbi:MAG: hypothetical protein AB7U95_30615 [Reyranella sp.]